METHERHGETTVHRRSETSPDTTQHRIPKLQVQTSPKKTENDDEERQNGIPLRDRSKRNPHSHEIPLSKPLPTRHHVRAHLSNARSTRWLRNVRRLWISDNRTSNDDFTATSSTLAAGGHDVVATRFLLEYGDADSAHHIDRHVTARDGTLQFESERVAVQRSVHLDASPYTKWLGLSGLFANLFAKTPLKVLTHIHIYRI